MELDKIIQLLSSPDENNVDLGLLQLSNVKGLKDTWFIETAEAIFNSQLEMVINHKCIEDSEYFRITFKGHEPPFYLEKDKFGGKFHFEREISDGIGGATTTVTFEKLNKRLQNSIEYGHFIDEIALKIKAELYNILIQNYD